MRLRAVKQVKSAPGWRMWPRVWGQPRLHADQPDTRPPIRAAGLLVRGFVLLPFNFRGESRCHWTACAETEVAARLEDPPGRSMTGHSGRGGWISPYASWLSARSLAEMRVSG